MRLMVVGVIAFLAGTASAQNATNLPFNPSGATRIVLANKFAGAAGGGVNDAPFHASGRTLEWVFSGSQVSMLAPGARLVSAGFRNATTTPGPAMISEFGDWTLTLSRALRAPGLLSPVIAENTGPDATVVRSAGLIVPANAIQGQPGAGAPSPFSFQVNFGNHYDYSGGNLHFVLSHDDSALNEPGVNLDGASPGDPGTNVIFQARKGDAAGATVTTQSVNTPVTQLCADAAIAMPLLTATTSNGREGFSGALGPTGFAGQFVIGAAQLRFVPRGSLITWLTFRLAPGASAWPATDATTSNFEIEVATSLNPPQEMGTFFGSNPLADALAVRSGPLTIPAGAFASGEPKFGVPIHFQRGFVYVGGDLCVTVRHAPFVGAGSGPMLDTANPASAIRTTVAASESALVGAFLPQDAAIALETGYTPSLCVPTALERVSGGSGAFVFDTPRTHQLVIDASQLTYLTPGSTVDGIAFRISPVSPLAYQSWPESDATVTQFDVYLSTAQNVASLMSDTFANNEGPDRVRVRAGELFIPARAMKVVGGEVAEHSYVIPFPTPFVYHGGGLCVTMRIGQRFGGTSVNFDGKFNTFGVNGKRNTQSSTATSANTTTALALATRLVFSRPPNACPADLNADGLVDDLDFVLFVQAYDFLLTPAADFNFDGVTDDADFQAFVGAYDALVCP
ncbi:MAG: hypothetical protein KF805_05600 [Phycisphaeraceae bacterium]|nr:hypothetical protein [Phycisphaeraceae bacterium]